MSRVLGLNPSPVSVCEHDTLSVFGSVDSSEDECLCCWGDNLRPARTPQVGI